MKKNQLECLRTLSLSMHTGTIASRAANWNATGRKYVDLMMRRNEMGMGIIMGG